MFSFDTVREKKLGRRTERKTVRISKVELAEIKRQRDILIQELNKNGISVDEIVGLLRFTITERSVKNIIKKKI